MKLFSQSRRSFIQTKQEIFPGCMKRQLAHILKANYQDTQHISILMHDTRGKENRKKEKMCCDLRRGKGA